MRNTRASRVKLAVYYDPRELLTFFRCFTLAVVDIGRGVFKFATRIGDSSRTKTRMNVLLLRVVIIIIFNLQFV